MPCRLTSLLGPPLVQEAFQRFLGESAAAQRLAPPGRRVCSELLGLWHSTIALQLSNSNRDGMVGW
ncbi:MAG: hypothetical protein WBB55_11720 [Anaerolineales bacterium]